MEEMEDPTEQLKDIQESLEDDKEKERWTLHVALSTAIIAVLAAIAGMLGNHHANEALLDQIKASDKWSFYQAKSIKGDVATSTIQLLAAMGKPIPASIDTAHYTRDKEKIKKDADEAAESSETHLKQHVIFSRGVTIFQVAIALSAIAILTRRKWVWYASMALAAAGSVFLVWGFF